MATTAGYNRTQLDRIVKSALKRTTRRASEWPDACNQIAVAVDEILAVPKPAQKISATSLTRIAQLARALDCALNTLDATTRRLIDTAHDPRIGALTREPVPRVLLARFVLVDLATHAEGEVPTRRRGRPTERWAGIVAKALALSWGKEGLSFECGKEDSREWPQLVKLVFGCVGLHGNRKYARAVSART